MCGNTIRNFVAPASPRSGPAKSRFILSQGFPVSPEFLVNKIVFPGFLSNKIVFDDPQKPETCLRRPQAGLVFEK